MEVRALPSPEKYCFPEQNRKFIILCPYPNFSLPLLVQEAGYRPALSMKRFSNFRPCLQFLQSNFQNRTWKFHTNFWRRSLAYGNYFYFSIFSLSYIWRCDGVIVLENLSEKTHLHNFLADEKTVRTRTVSRSYKWNELYIFTTCGTLFQFRPHQRSEITESGTVISRVCTDLTSLTSHTQVSGSMLVNSDKATANGRIIRHIFITIDAHAVARKLLAKINIWKPLRVIRFYKY